MDWTPAAVGSSSSSAANYGESTGMVRASPDEMMVSASTGRNVAPPRDPADFPHEHSATAAGTPLGGQSGQRGREGVVAHQGVGSGAAVAVPSRNHRPEGGRDREKTLPAWMAAGPAALPDGRQQQVTPVANAPTQTPRPTGLYSSRPQQGAPSKQKAGPSDGDRNSRANINNRNRNNYDEEPHRSVGAGATPDMSTLYAMARESRNHTPAPRTPTTAAPRPSANPRSAGRGRGRERTLPAWMTAAEATPPGGLQQQSAPGTTSGGRVPEPTGSFSSCPQQTTQTTAHGRYSVKNTSSEDNQTAKAAATGTFHVGVGHHGNPQRQRRAPGGQGISHGIFETLREQYPGSAGVSMAGASGARPTTHHQSLSSTVAGHGRGLKVRRWVRGGTRDDGTPGGLRPYEEGPFDSVPRASRPTGSYSSRPGHRTQGALPNSCGSSRYKAGTNRKGRRAAGIGTRRPERSASTNPEIGSWHTNAERIDGQSPVPAGTVDLNGAPERGLLVADPSSQHQELATTAGEERGGGQSRPKRGREEEPGMASTGSVSRARGGESGRQPAGLGGLLDVIRRTASMNLQPPAKKNKVALSKSSPPKFSASVPRTALSLQNLVATRARFQIVHHHDAPKQQQQLVAHRSKLPTLNTAGEARRTSKSKGSSRAPLAGAALSSRPSRSTTPKKVVIDGNDVALCHRGADGQWSAQGPLLAIQFFEQRGVPCVAFLPRERMAGVSPRDGCNTAFQEARAKGAISEIPRGEKGDLFILKYAIESKVHVVTNKRLSTHAASNETLGG
ncbi:expressed unknown protein [Ectocarpus siliculosus]|uniref:RNase NYN domain-containing protein n=1 Tax=Ectocarpus siliculosus TaxID=2880 RepID=D7FTX8_ECTSI|nr:expressed unknown protein [Ectocarpus siliculosus]|eukprot:CBJ31505.1 expressed unknown protein [Ectocarpus siliculosus]